MEVCIFDKIIRGEIPSAKVWEDENYLAFLSIAPINPGHTLVIPKKHTEYVFDLPNVELCKLFKVCKPIAQALKKIFSPSTGKIGIMVSGGEIPHVHIHLIPIHHEGDLTFERAKHNIPFEELESNAQKIKLALVGS